MGSSSESSIRSQSYCSSYNFEAYKLISSSFPIEHNYEGDDVFLFLQLQDPSSNSME
ncbi:hypothetical protein COLO4_19808 [Corchorus olitorius]|uniref:Uncharacterized protein n=1 Tax=Corchorus olitorius TaxID=93759 RepID=A0A1R3J3A7_9ROSI|nr:hypothetical protein COLO4_19808 [Corchorus olitorius]